MSMGLYILKGHLPIQEHDVKVWGRWMETAERRVAHTTVGTLDVSTVFLGIDHGWGCETRLFETMVFGPRDILDNYTRRYATWEDAEAGHAEVVQSLLETAAAKKSAPN